MYSPRTHCQPNAYVVAASDENTIACAMWRRVGTQSASAVKHVTCVAASTAKVAADVDAMLPAPIGRRKTYAVTDSDTEISRVSPEISLRSSSAKCSTNSSRAGPRIATRNTRKERSATLGPNGFPFEMS